jgi:hypothetical protein
MIKKAREIIQELIPNAGTIYYRTSLFIVIMDTIYVWR